MFELYFEKSGQYNSNKNKIISVLLIKEYLTPQKHSMHNKAFIFICIRIMPQLV